MNILKLLFVPTAPKTCSHTDNSQGPVNLSQSEKAPIKQQAKDLETKLTNLGIEKFAKQHEKAREEERAIYVKAQFCITDLGRNLKCDYKFGTPEKRYEYLLHKAQKYQKDSAIDTFTTDEETKFDTSIKTKQNKIKEMEQALCEAKENLKKDIQNRTQIVKSNAEKLMKFKLTCLENLFNESQQISDRHKEVKEEIEAGDLP